MYTGSFSISTSLQDTSKFTFLKFIYEFCLYSLFQTSGATDFEYFEIGGDSYLAVSNSVGPIKNGNFNFETTSFIYKANKAIRQFEVFQEIPTYG